MRIRIVGPGRAGLSFSNAFNQIGWDVIDVLGKEDDISEAAQGVDLVLLTVPDHSVAHTASCIRRNDSAVITHVAGSLTLTPIDGHKRRASCHPLLSLPNPSIGGTRLLDEAWFAVAGDPIAVEIVQAFGGRSFQVPDEKRVLYHATACVAANHLVVLLAQVQRLCEIVDLPFEAFEDLIQGTLDSVIEIGPKGSLTGPAVRGDFATIQSHLDALPESETNLYRSLTEAAQEFATNLNNSQNMNP